MSGEETRPLDNLKTEKINGVYIRVGSLADFLQEVLGVELSPAVLAAPIRVRLGVEKYWVCRRRQYRLVWISRRTAWLAAEDTTQYRRRRDADEAGRRIEAETGAFFQ